MHWTFFRSETKRFVRGKKKKTKTKTNKLRRKRWQSRGCAKLKQQISNLAQIASHSLHLRLLLLFLLLSSFSPSSLSSFRGDYCGFSLCLGWFWILFFFFMFPMALVHVTWLGRIQSPSYTWLGRIYSPSYTCLALETRKLLIFEIGKMFQPLDL